MDAGDSLDLAVLVRESFERAKGDKAKVIEGDSIEVEPKPRR
jgi:hypothetical protein